MHCCQPRKSVKPINHGLLGSTPVRRRGRSTCVSVTDANDDEGGGAVEHAECYIVKDDTVEEVGERKAEDDGDDAPDCQPDGARGEYQHEDDDCDDRDDSEADVMPERTSHLVVKHVITTVQDTHLARHTHIHTHTDLLGSTAVNNNDNNIRLMALCPGLPR